MNRPVEPWSTPWHALLKDLANRVRVEPTAVDRLVDPRTFGPAAAGPSLSWLGRARGQNSCATLSTF